MRAFQPTPEQKRILDLSTGRHLVLAPPGAGKTELLARRVGAAIESGIPPESMLCITFTNRGARNMRARAGDLPGKRPYIGTLHTFGLRFLFANGLIAANTVLLDEEDAEQVLGEAIESTLEETKRGFAPKLQEAARYIRTRNEQRIRLDISGNAQSPDVFLEQVATRYEEIKRDSCSIDFDDVLHLTLASLLHGARARMGAFSWLQVDEVQDLSELQWAIVSRLITADAHVVYFGDYDQAIFSFMGASHSALTKFTAGSTTHHLAENFRSPPSLIAAFNAYAAANLPSRKELRLRPPRDSNRTDGSIQVQRCSGTFDDETQKIATTVIPDLVAYHATTAVLTRTNADAESVSKRLTDRGIGNFKVSGFDLFRRRPIKDVMAFLRVRQYPHDRSAWTRLLATFGGADSLRASRQLVNELVDAGMNPTDWLAGSAAANPVDDFAAALPKGRYVVFDTETTGLDPMIDDIVQIAAVELVDGVPTGQEFEVFLHTERSLESSVKVHGITPASLAARGVTPADGLSGFIGFAGDAPIIGHNVAFDLAIMQGNVRRAGLAWQPASGVIDTLALARRLFPRLASYRLGSLLATLQVEGKNTHNALDDVRATAALAVRLAAAAKEGMSRRRKVATQYTRYLTRLATTLTPLWLEIGRRMEEDANLGEIVERFFDHARSHARYTLSADDQKHVDTLTGYLAHNTPRRPLLKLLSSLVPELSTYSESDLITGREKVVVSTIHKAKGLQFEGVVVTACVDDVYPNYYSKKNRDPAAIEEDARLLYVAMTRAQKSLVLTMHDTAINRGGTFPRYPSPFLQFLSQ